ncbi:aminoglycoside phosphotransferase family protein [Pigmentibacter ruber]|uniref:aminoglycoside phosphotransferase family protein n=1 Tax=Pigmentibacter ruber TaxID=2683196 RepID=UPI00131B356E|nr:phosphotransferase [Pigmentibacter ruber]BFD30560.1 phosphotransferase [Pigmentibacter ruber]
MSGTFTLPLESEQLMLRIQDFKIINSDQIHSNHEPVLILIAGDASDRKFFRLLGKEISAICMQFPKWEGGYGGDPISWIGMHNALSKMGLPVPKVIEIDETNSCIWTEDLGDIFLTSILSEEKLDIDNPNCNEPINYYKKALDLLIKAQYPDIKIDHPAINRFFDFEKLYYELNFFITHFLNGFLNLNISEDNPDYNNFYQDLKLLCKKLDSCERVLCHRDYHVRNIMLKDNELFWIDFQDARMGPHSYDVVSLVRDSYVKITWKTRQYFYDYYIENLNKVREKNNLNHISALSFNLELLLMGLQRNIKAIGSFGYLATKKNKPNYLKYIHQTLSILCSKEAQIHEETDIKAMLPNLFKLLYDLHEGSLKEKLNDKIINFK